MSRFLDALTIRLERRHRRRTIRYAAHHRSPAVTTIQPNRSKP